MKALGTAIGGCAVVVAVGLTTLAAAAGDGAPSAERAARQAPPAAGVCAEPRRVGFCGADRATIEDGRASATTYPPDEVLGKDPETGFYMVKPSPGPGVRTGIAPSRSVEVVVLDRDRRVLRRARVAQDGGYEVAVPAQGTGARVGFVDAAGETLATRPAEG